VNSLKHTLVILFALFYLIISTGLTLVQMNCACSGQKSLYVHTYHISPESEPGCDSCCAPEVPSTCCNTTDSDSDSCGCTVPEINFIRLSNVIGGEIAVLRPVLSIQTLLVLQPECRFDFTYPAEVETVKIKYYPPENQLSGRCLINFISQRKIAPLT